MQITSTRPTLAPRNQAVQNPSSESSTFLNEPTVPMDAVMRGYQSLDFSKAKDILGFAALGAAGGALAGSVSNGAWMIPASIVSTAAVDTAGVYVDSKITQDPWGGLATAVAPVIGAGAGAVGGALAFGLTALTGLNPVASGAIAGGLTHLAIAVASEN